MMRQNHILRGARRRGLIATLDAQILVGGLILVAILAWRITGERVAQAQVAETQARLERLLAAGRADLVRHYGVRDGALSTSRRIVPSALRPALIADDDDPALLPSVSSFGHAFYFCYVRPRAGAITLFAWTALPEALAGRGTNAALPSTCRAGTAPVLSQRSEVSAAEVDSARLWRLPGGPADAATMSTHLVMGGQDIGTKTERLGQLAGDTLALADKLEVVRTLKAEAALNTHGRVHISQGYHNSRAAEVRGDVLALSGQFAKVITHKFDGPRLIATELFVGNEGTIGSSLSVRDQLRVYGLSSATADIAQVTVSGSLAVTDGTRVDGIDTGALGSTSTTFHARQAAIGRLHADTCTGDC